MSPNGQHPLPAREVLSGGRDAVETCLEGFPDPVFWLDRQARVAAANTAACRSLGYDRQELEGLDLGAMDPSFNPEGWEIFWGQLEGKGWFGFPASLRRKDGVVIKARVRGRRLDTPLGEVVCAVARPQDYARFLNDDLPENLGQLRDVFEAMPDSAYLKDGQGRWRLANQAGLEVFGLHWSEYQGKTDAELAEMAPRHRQALLHCARTDEDAWRGGRPTQSQEQAPQPQGEPRIFDVTKIPLFDAEGGRKALVVLARDVTAQKRDQERLKRSEALLAETQRIASLGSWEWDFRTREAIWSEETYRVLGVDPSLDPIPLDTFVAEMVHPEDRPALENLLVQAARSREPIEIDYRMIHPARGLRWLRSRGEGSLDAAGRITRLVGTVQDITRQHEARRRIERSERMLAEAQRISHLGSWERNLGTGAGIWSEETYRIMGLEPGAPIPSPREVLERVHPDDREAVWQSYNRAVQERGSADMVFRLRRQDGRWRWLHGRAEARAEEKTGELMVLGTVQDITEQREAESQLALAAKVWENSVEGVVITDAAGTIVNVNQAYTIITGFSPEEVVGARAPFLLRGQPGWDQRRGVIVSLRRHGEWRGEMWARTKEGQAYPLWVTVTAVTDNRDRLTHYVGLMHDLSDLRRSEEELRYQAQHDALTGLPNRALLHDRLEVALKHAAHRGARLAVLFLDLDNFKNINDSLGHQAGDQLLREAAHRIKQRVGPEVTVARLGGDDFILVLEDVPRAEAAAAKADVIQEVLSLPYHLQGRELFVTASIGVTLYPEDGEDPSTLIKNAEMAMYRAKAEGRSRCQLFTSALNEQTNKRLALENDLRRALDRGEFLLHYQPIVDASTGEVPACEALLRWERPGLGLVSPADFIPIAEETGIIVPIGMWVIEVACRQAQAWREGGRDLRVSINLSARQFLQPDLVALVEACLRESGLPPRCLELEITESALMLNVRKAVEIMGRLTTLGVRLTLDDFGTGYSSLMYLKNFPISALKVDQQFVRGVPDDPDDSAIVATIVGMAKSLKLEVVAEGVEIPAQLGFLRGLGCQLMQGYQFSRPLPAAQFVRFRAPGRGTRY